jgi:hypothetical protein
VAASSRAVERSCYDGSEGHRLGRDSLLTMQGTAGYIKQLFVHLDIPFIVLLGLI